MMKGLGEKKELGLLRLEKRRLRGKPLLVFQCAEGWCREDGGQLFSARTKNRTRGSGLRPEYEGALAGRDSC